MKKQTLPMEIDIHLLDLRYAHTRIKNATALAKMQNSITRYGQIVPAFAVPENKQKPIKDRIATRICSRGDWDTTSYNHRVFGATTRECNGGRCFIFPYLLSFQQHPSYEIGDVGRFVRLFTFLPHENRWDAG